MSRNHEKRSTRTKINKSYHSEVKCTAQQVRIRCSVKYEADYDKTKHMKHVQRDMRHQFNCVDKVAALQCHDRWNAVIWKALQVTRRRAVQE